MDGAKFSTSLREDARTKIEHLRETDIVIGIPAYFSGLAIEHVLQSVITGLRTHYNKHKSLIVVFDGGSTDDTREYARSVTADDYNIEVIVSIYRGIPGKGSSLRAVFEVAKFLKAKAVAVFDSDLKSITPQWVKNVLDPIFEGYDFVAPDYYRYKFDGTITNTIAYNLTRALYGMNIRQPIGGDFGVSSYLIRHYLDQDVWETDVAKFGIDIWMTTTAITNRFRICQTRLGAKIHGEKDPGSDLSPMFRQVVGTIFTMMESHYDYWAAVAGSQDAPTFGQYCDTEIQPFDIDQDTLIDYFKIGFENFGGVWERLLEPHDMAVVEQLASQPDSALFNLPIESWVRIVYHYAQAFHATPRQKFKVMDTLIPLYNARVASLINELRDKDMEAAETYFNQQAQVFVDMKPYLLSIWT